MAVNRDFAKNYNLNGGELFIKGSDEDNYKYFGATSEFKINFKSTTLEHKNSEGDTLTIDMEVVKEVEASLSFSTEDLNKDALALAFGGVHSTVTQASGDTTDQAFTAVVAKAVYDLGKRKVSNVVASYNDGSDDIAMEQGTDYSVDAVFGTIEIADGSPAVGNDIKVSYHYAEVKVTDFTSLNKTSREFSLRFNSRNKAGSNKQTTVHRVRLSLNGDYELKSIEKYTKISFNGKVLKDETRPDGKQFVETVEVV